jgi:hypothetical protein
MQQPKSLHLQQCGTHAPLVLGRLAVSTVRLNLGFLGDFLVGLLRGGFCSALLIT